MQHAAVLHRGDSPGPAASTLAIAVAVRRVLHGVFLRYTGSRLAQISDCCFWELYLRTTSPACPASNTNTQLLPHRQPPTTSAAQPCPPGPLLLLMGHHPASRPVN